MKRRILQLIAVASAFAGFGLSDPSGEAREDLFTARIKPLLSLNCLPCHGEKDAQGGLRLDTRAGLLKGGARGPAAVPGDPDASLLIKSVRYDLEELRMPPFKQLEEEEIADLVRWVRAGAHYGAERRD